MSISPAAIPSDAVVENPFTSFVTEFTPWGYCCSDLYSVVIKSPKLTAASDEPNQNHDNKPNSDDPNDTKPTVLFKDERKLRRMLSNRESARRSRMRKQKHLENLRNQVNRLRIENRGISNRIRFALYSCHRLRTENDRLRSEQSMLRQKLWDIHRIILVSQQLQQYNNNTPGCMAIQ